MTFGSNIKKFEDVGIDLNKQVYIYIYLYILSNLMIIIIRVDEVNYTFFSNVSEHLVIEMKSCLLNTTKVGNKVDDTRYKI